MYKNYLPKLYGIILIIFCYNTISIFYLFLKDTPQTKQKNHILSLLKEKFEKLQNSRKINK